ncbi:MAG: hypothetical protein JWQ06_1630 [Mucilaginibacter sp.]|nr:hypothetical protein [Mucilaginibacter sp.]
MLLILASCVPVSANAYSILTHEAIIDASWGKSIQPLLKKKFPKATEADLKLAHSYAYGGSLMTDIGYSPFGSTYFTNLIHYVRSGDLVENLLSEAQNMNEYAYALGALCHYMADSYGHSFGTNLVESMVYPKIRKKYGNVVTYEENPTAHSRVEIAFDVLQLARGNYESQSFHDFIGFNVAVPVLERAFYKTYGQDLNEIFGNVDHSVNNFRWAVNSLMPTVTRSAWVQKKIEIQKMQPGITSRKFNYKMRRKKYYEEFGHDVDKPKFKERVMAFIITVLPKIGPFKSLRFKEIGPDGEKQFIKSFDTVMTHYTNALAQLNYGTISLPNVNFDTGKKIVIGDYKITDDTYNQLVLKLQDNKFSCLTRPLKQNILSFYSHADTAAIAKKDPSGWKKTSTALQQIKTAPPISIDSLKIIEALQDKKRVANTAGTK